MFRKRTCLVSMFRKRTCPPKPGAQVPYLNERQAAEAGSFHSRFTIHHLLVRGYLCRQIMKTADGATTIAMMISIVAGPRRGAADAACAGAAFAGSALKKETLSTFKIRG